ncbi:MAG: conjugal transfer protein TraD [Bradyrhizobium sp.]|nr:conjugal transfer protein TraD [Bradyrhizobium sp.]
MRKPRDIDAELRALADKTKQLKTRKITQLGELVVATGADELEPELLAGALLAAVQSKAASAREDWRSKGEAFFRKGGGRRPGAAADGDGARSGQGAGSAAAGGSGSSA